MSTVTDQMVTLAMNTYWANNDKGRDSALAMRAASARGCSHECLMKQIIDMVPGDRPSVHIIDAVLEDR